MQTPLHTASPSTEPPNMAALESALGAVAQQHRLPASIAIVAFDTTRTGGIETLALDIEQHLSALGVRCVMVCPRRVCKGWIGRQLGRGRFMVELTHALRDVDAVLAMHQLFLGPIRVAMRARFARPTPHLWCWLHGIEVWGSALCRAKAQLERCDAMIASSAFTRDRVVERSGNWPPCHVVHPLGESVDGSLAPTPLPEPIVLLTVSRISRGWGYKGHRLVLDALARLRATGTLPDSLEWRIVGSGDDFEGLSDAVRAAGLHTTVRLLGRVDRAQLEREYRNCSLLVMPSAYSVDSEGVATGEGFGIVYLEAANAGRASLACTEGGQTDLIAHGVNGWLVRPDAEELSQQLLRLITNRELVATAGRVAHAIARERFSVDCFRNSLCRAMGH